MLLSATGVGYTSCVCLPLWNGHTEQCVVLLAEHSSSETVKGSDVHRKLNA